MSNINVPTPNYFENKDKIQMLSRNWQIKNLGIDPGEYINLEPPSESWTLEIKEDTNRSVLETLSDLDYFSNDSERKNILLEIKVEELEGELERKENVIESLNHEIDYLREQMELQSEFIDTNKHRLNNPITLVDTEEKFLDTFGSDNVTNMPLEKFNAGWWMDELTKDNGLVDGLKRSATETIINNDNILTNCFLDTATCPDILNNIKTMVGGYGKEANEFKFPWYAPAGLGNLKGTIVDSSQVLAELEKETPVNLEFSPFGEISNIAQAFYTMQKNITDATNTHPFLFEPNDINTQELIQERMNLYLDSLVNKAFVTFDKENFMLSYRPPLAVEYVNFEVNYDITPEKLEDPYSDVNFDDLVKK